MTTTAPSVGASSAAALARPSSALVIRPASRGRAAVLVAEEHLVRARHHSAPRADRARERLHELFEERCDRLRAMGQGHRLAVDAEDVRLTFDELDARANQLARHLQARGVRPGARVALLLDRPVMSYVAMLAVSKIHAAFVPLDMAFPSDRIAYIVSDANVGTVLSLSTVHERVEGLDALAAELVLLDEDADAIAALESGRLSGAERGAPVESLVWIIYTSGSTGRPKGVAVEHRSACNFIRVAGEVYGLRPDDRVYQGMTIAFDFSVEEIWVPWVAGATLVPKPVGAALVGAELSAFLTARGVTALCCVPTLLSTLEDELPQLRFLLVSGEACPQDLIERWHRPDRRFLNVYGPTETTVTATWTDLHPDRPVTIGVPLPTYSVVVLNADDPRQALPRGEIGEIGIAGVGLAREYVNREEKTAEAFVPDFLDLGDIVPNPSGRIYRTGDLGRINDRGEIEYHGRIDLQVKIRGYRIELSEIESVLLQVPGIAGAVVDTYAPVSGSVELVGYYTVRSDSEAPDQEQMHSELRKRLPPYMVPAYFVRLEVIPTTVGGKADRARLPPPRTRYRAQRAHVPAITATERGLADELARVMGLETVSVDSHFFDDLGANSLIMAQFATRVRSRPELPAVSMRDIYLQPTVKDLAAAGNPRTPEAIPEPVTVAEPVSRASYLLCGALQLTAFTGYAYLVVWLSLTVFDWVRAGTTWLDLYLRGSGAAVALFVGMCAVPIVAKWLLIGRWRPEEFRIWGLRYVRFWVVRTLLQFSPLQAFVGSPLYNIYLRSLGARIGERVVILSRNPPVCTDLLTVGPDTVIRKDSFFSGYRARAGLIQTGPVALGRAAFVGEATVLDIDTVIGDAAQIGHASSLHEGQVIPAGQRWHGSPAQPTVVNYLRITPARCGVVRRTAYSCLQLATLLLLALPVAIVVAVLVVDPLVVAPTWSTTTSWFYAAQMAGSALLYFGPIITGLLFVITVPRVLNLLVKPETTYPLYGFRYFIQRSIAGLTNVRFFMTLTGDSSYIVHFLRGLGYDLGRVVQTGSNFGVEQKHETPFQSAVGEGTMVSDGLSMMNTEFSSSSFRVSTAAVGPRNFVGNNVAYPAGGRTGDNCLIGTKTMIPLDGHVRENTGLLGSPPFEIPRSVQRDGDLGERTPEELRQGLRKKLQHNTVTIGIFLLVRWIYLLWVVSIVQLAEDSRPWIGESALVAAVFCSLLFGVAYFVLAERASTGFRSLTPKFCSIYDPYFWWHERFWKLDVGGVIAIFNGTPFKNTIWRTLGVRIGHRVFDDGCAMPEKSLVTIGDGVALNARSTIQCHSLEDGAFKSDHIRIGKGCTVGTGAFVHYGTVLHEGAVLAPDSFLMKGEEVPPHARWGGNPARQERTAIVPNCDAPDGGSRADALVAAPPDGGQPGALHATPPRGRPTPTASRRTPDHGRPGQPDEGGEAVR